ncbi:glycoside hydrolase family 27 protein [Pedobacter mucosus]|uniref:glycoside hydrolase family 27 protein n=1 Tax=Pedobacter mucosus TaxID=2895286 RepID=UPI001EE4E5F0|nr:glycoside hydrolase family 27 protein [Pedobacter mucosus]UKT64945.1 glycoside hydrolase family 27 protein [Pedobacter mucosus]
MRKTRYLPLAILLFGNFIATAQTPNWGMSRVANVQLPSGEKTQRINNTPKIIAAATPPMGWNSWNNFGLQVTEDEFKKQVDYVAEKLKPVGYSYVIIDASWYSPSVSADKKSKYHHATYAKHDAVLDKYGRYLPADNKFPSAKGSFKYMADYVHRKGLKFGLHIQRGIPWQAVEQDLPIKGSSMKAKDIANPADICLWFNATYGIDMSVSGAQDYYNSLFELYASWEVDFLKVDDLSMPYHADEITAIRKAIEKSGRNMVFSTSPGSTPISARYHVLNNADMFRVSSDFWDTWPQLKQQFSYAKSWATFAVNAPGRWADLDMLPVGKIATRSGDSGGERFTRFTKDEQYTLVTLWSICRSPLIISNDLTQNDDFTLKLLTNKEVIAVNQEGSMQKEAFNDKGIVIWEANAKENAKYLSIFNLNDQEENINIPFINLKLGQKYKVKNLWSGEEMGKMENNLTAKIPAHGAVLYHLK